MTAMMPALAVTELLHERATASARCRREACRMRGEAVKGPRFATRRTGERGGWVPAGELGVKDRSVVSSHVKPIVAANRAHRRQDDAVGVDEAARWTPVTLHLDDGRGDGVHDVGHLSREFVQHERIVADAAIGFITRLGRKATVRLHHDTQRHRGHREIQIVLSASVPRCDVIRSE